ncbi:unnamed protein product [Rotaria sp. Silwood1]|nr:unnamed protein product [Rotaria sp. Silwood1]CAF1185481.1 unnamed protein product [Rotaria sp. Silwood1]CAF1188450.1 unnamed protein product [Rotaria sp. Silwood1]CAF3478819.1 unnamed protein product [Rotaria sp. Silwood1]CAF3482166.1 unnamed protein product [Rotaria sp. Silwood1]
MLKIQYLIVLILFQVCHLFVLLDISSKPSVLKYNGDKITSFHYKNPYYTISNSSSSSLIDYMRTLYEQEKQNDIKSDYNLIRALVPRIVEIDNVTMYVFDLNVIRRMESIYAVSLHFYKRRTRWPISYSLNEIYSSHRLSSLSAQIQLESDAYGWQSFPIGDVIQRQINYLKLSQKSEYFGITFKPTVTTKNQRRNIIELEKFSVYTPFLIVYSNDSKQTNIFEEFIPKNFEQDVKSYEQFETEVNKRNRLRRFIEEKQSTLDSNTFLSNWNDSISILEPETCSVKPFVIDFSDLGFASWMIEPKNFMANLCSGSCQTKLMTNHALLQHFLQRLGIRNDINLPKAGCVPERYSSLTMFYKSSDYNYLIRRLPNMIVEACHCR